MLSLLKAASMKLTIVHYSHQMKPTTSKERLKYLFKFTDFIGIYTDHTHNNYCIGLRTVFSVDDFLLGQRVFVARSTGTAIALF